MGLRGGVGGEGLEGEVRGEVWEGREGKGRPSDRQHHNNILQHFKYTNNLSSKHISHCLQHHKNVRI